MIKFISDIVYCSTNVSYVGQVEIQYKGTWGAVCDGNRHIEDAHVDDDELYLITLNISTLHTYVCALVSKCGVV